MSRTIAGGPTANDARILAIDAEITEFYARIGETAIQHANELLALHGHIERLYTERRSLADLRMLIHQADIALGREMHP